MKCSIPVESADTVNLVPSVFSYKARAREKNPGNEVGVQCVQQQRKRQKSNKGVVTLVIDNNNFAGAACFLVHLLPVPARLRLETS